VTRVHPRGLLEQRDGARSFCGGCPCARCSLRRLPRALFDAFRHALASTQYPPCHPATAAPVKLTVRVLGAELLRLELELPAPPDDESDDEYNEDPPFGFGRTP
jgi:hypothetical protein